MITLSCYDEALIATTKTMPMMMMVQVMVMMVTTTTMMLMKIVMILAFPGAGNNLDIGAETLEFDIAAVLGRTVSI